MLKKELQIFTFEDLLNHFPLRHLDRTSVQSIGQINPSMDHVQVRGVVISMEQIGERRAKRLVVYLRDKTGIIEMTWFQGINWVQKLIQIGQEYLAFGKLGFFLGKPQLNHPEIESVREHNASGKLYLEPIYPVTEKLKARGLNGRALGKLMEQLFLVLEEKELPEYLPEHIIKKYKFINRFRTYQYLHFPPSIQHYQHAVERMKYEEFFIAQLRLGMLRSSRHRYSRGVIFSSVGEVFNTFFTNIFLLK